MDSSTGCRGEKAAKEAQRLFDRELVWELSFLQLDADTLAELAGCGAPIEAEQLDLAGVGVGEAFADLDGGGLAGAIGAEQAEALAAVDFEIEAIDGDHIGEGFAQGAEEERRDAGMVAGRWRGCRQVSGLRLGQSGAPAPRLRREVTDEQGELRYR